MAIFIDFACILNSALQWLYRENEERSLHQIWSVCYWSPMSMFGWVLNKSKIWPKMVIFAPPAVWRFLPILPVFQLRPYRAVSWERREISSPNLVSVLLKPHVNVWLSFKQIQNLTQNGDFAPPAVWRFFPILPVFQLRQYTMLISSRTKKDLFTKLGQCSTEAPCKCLVEF